MWGIYDPVEKVWMGNDEGPRLFEDQVLARVSAEVTDVVLGYPRRRCLEKPYPGGPVRFKGTVENKVTPLEAIQGMENGRFL